MACEGFAFGGLAKEGHSQPLQRGLYKFRDKTRDWDVEVSQRYVEDKSGLQTDDPRRYKPMRSSDQEA